VTDILFELKLLSFDTLTYNSHYVYSIQSSVCESCENEVVMN